MTAGRRAEHLYLRLLPDHEENQKALFADKVRRVLLEGAREEVRAEEAKTVGRPGTSEHQLGLALISWMQTIRGWKPGRRIRLCSVWLMKKQLEIRFCPPLSTSESSITGIIYEPWHYRYVGQTGGGGDVCQGTLSGGIFEEERGRLKMGGPH